MFDENPGALIANPGTFGAKPGIFCANPGVGCCGCAQIQVLIPVVAQIQAFALTIVQIHEVAEVEVVA